MDTRTHSGANLSKDNFISGTHQRKVRKHVTDGDSSSVSTCLFKDTEMDEKKIGTAVMDCDKPFVSCYSACSLFMMQSECGLATEATEITEEKIWDSFL